MAPKRSRSQISESQLTILRSAYDGGLKSCAGMESKTKIARLSVETGLTCQQIQNWIGNHRKTCLSQRDESHEHHQMREDADDPAPSAPINAATSIISTKAPLFRKANAWNLFYSHHAKHDPYNSMDFKERNQAIKLLYDALNEDEKAAWLGRARETNNDVNAYSPEMVKKVKMQLQKQFQFLSSAGCRAVCLLKDEQDVLWNLGTPDAESFLDQHPEVENAYRSFLSVPPKFTNEDVRQLFNKKYAEGIQVVGAAVPYSKKMYFEVEGLPAGIRFQKPGAYGTQQVQRIMTEKDSITFIINNREALLSKKSLPRGEREEGSDLIRTILLRLVDISIVDSVLNLSKTIQEEEIDVMVSLNSDEKKILSSSLKYFDEDAKVLVKQIIAQNSDVAVDPTETPTDDEVVLPCYSNMAKKELFWLFLTTAEEAKKKTGIRGKWLDKVPAEKYSYQVWSDEEGFVDEGNVITRNGEKIPLPNFTKEDGNYAFVPQSIISLESYIKELLHKKKKH